LLIADVAMAQQDGLKLLREARRLQPHLTVIAVSGRPSPYTEPEVLEAGASALLLKPFLIDELRARATQHGEWHPTGRFGRLGPVDAAPAEGPQGLAQELVRTRQSIVSGERTVNVLVVEDNAGDVELLRRMLNDRTLGVFEVTAVGRLSEAVTHLAAHPVDIVLLDLGLPDAMGLEALRAVHAVAPDVPLIVLTGSIDQATASQALQEGAQDVLIKGGVADHSLQRMLHYAIERQRSLADADQARAQQQRIKDLSQADQLRLRDQFLSHVSHELRTPLAAIHWFTTNLLEGLLGEVNPEQREHLDTTLKNANQLKTMLDDLLDSARANTGKLGVTPRRLRLDDVVAEAVVTSQARATEAGVTCLVAIPLGLPPAWADPDRTRQVLINLLDNGIKFTPHLGTIAVEVHVDDDARFLRISVTDSGCGVATEDRSRIFERLFQASHGVDSSRMGLGLGLFISSELIALQGGRIWVDGEIGQGATFSFTLPVFSLRALCAPILTARHLGAGVMSVLTVEARQEGEATGARIARLLEMGKILERCIVTGQDMVLPRLFGPKSTEPYFILASTDATGAAAIERRIRQLLSHDMPVQYATHRPTISATIIKWPRLPDGELEAAVTHIVSRLQELVLDTASAPR
jgi:signal transduction histidine kinase